MTVEQLHTPKYTAHFLFSHPPVLSLTSRTMLRVLRIGLLGTLLLACTPPLLAVPSADDAGGSSTEPTVQLGNTSIVGTSFTHGTVVEEFFGGALALVYNVSKHKLIHS